VLAHRGSLHVHTYIAYTHRCRCICKATLIGHFRSGSVDVSLAHATSGFQNSEFSSRGSTLPPLRLTHTQNFSAHKCWGGLSVCVCVLGALPLYVCDKRCSRRNGNHLSRAIKGAAGQQPFANARMSPKAQQLRFWTSHSSWKFFGKYHNTSSNVFKVKFGISHSALLVWSFLLHFLDIFHKFYGLLNNGLVQVHDLSELFVR